VRIGMTPAQVRDELGPPNGERRSGDEILWVYGNGARLTFEDGQLVTVAGIDYVGGEGEKSGDQWLTPETAPETRQGVRFSDGRSARSTPSEQRRGVYFENDAERPTTAPKSDVPKVDTKGFVLSPAAGGSSSAPGTQGATVDQMGSVQVQPAPENAAGFPRPAQDDPLDLVPLEDELSAPAGAPATPVTEPEDALSKQAQGLEQSLVDYNDAVNEVAEMGGYDPEAVKALSGMPSMPKIEGLDAEKEVEQVRHSLGGFFLLYCITAFISFGLIWILMKVFNDEMMFGSMAIFALVDALIIVGVQYLMVAVAGFPIAVQADYLAATIVMALVLPALSSVKDQVRSFKIVFLHKVLQKVVLIALGIFAFAGLMGLLS